MVFIDGEGEVMVTVTLANNQLHANPAMAPLFHAESRGRRVGELRRSAI